MAKVFLVLWALTTAEMSWNSFCVYVYTIVDFLQSYVEKCQEQKRKNKVRFKQVNNAF